MQEVVSLLFVIVKKFEYNAMKGMNGILDCRFSLFTRVYLQLLQLLPLKIIYCMQIKYFFSATSMLLVETFLS